MVEHRSAESEGLRFRSSWGLRFYSLSHARDKTKTYFSISLPSLKLTISPISIYKHYAIDVAESRSMQDASYMNFVVDLTHCGSVVEHQSAESEGLREDSSWGLKIFPTSLVRLCHDSESFLDS